MRDPLDWLLDMGSLILLGLMAYVLWQCILYLFHWQKLSERSVTLAEESVTLQREANALLRELNARLGSTPPPS
jgi:hypothetical protein